jgi:hypothetical protein
MSKNKLSTVATTGDPDIYGRKIVDVNEIYKGDGITSCKWCGNTGWMHTFSINGFFFHDAPCFCKFGEKVWEAERNEL